MTNTIINLEYKDNPNGYLLCTATLENENEQTFVEFNYTNFLNFNPIVLLSRETSPIITKFFGVTSRLEGDTCVCGATKSYITIPDVNDEGELILYLQNKTIHSYLTIINHFIITNKAKPEEQFIMFYVHNAKTKQVTSYRTENLTKYYIKELFTLMETNKSLIIAPDHRSIRLNEQIFRTFIQRI